MTAKVTKNGQVIEVQTEDLQTYYAWGWKPVEETESSEPVSFRRSKKQADTETTEE